MVFNCTIAFKITVINIITKYRQQIKLTELINIWVSETYLWGLWPGPEIIKLFLCTTQLSMKFILLKNVKMPTIVGILTFISMINTISERLKAINFFNCRYFSFYEQLKFSAELSWARKKFYNLGPRYRTNQPAQIQRLARKFNLHL